MNQKPITVVGIYATRATVETAVEAFRDAGFKNTDISLVVPKKTNAKNLFALGATRSTEDASPVAREGDPHEGPLSWLEEGGTARIDGEDAFIIAGPIAQALNDIDSRHPTERLAAALNNFGVPRASADEYAWKVVQRRALLSIHCDSAEEAAMARRLYGDLGGTDIYLTTGQVEIDSNKLDRRIAHCAGR